MENTFDLDDLSHEQLLAISESVLDRLSAADLKGIRDLAEKKWLEKLEDAKNEVIAEMKEKFDKLGLSFEEVITVYSGRRRRNSGRRRRNNPSRLPPRYISPTGRTWSGRGYPPAWIRDIEEAGGSREDFRI
jgi:DNA-binding protein H-NS